MALIFITLLFNTTPVLSVSLCLMSPYTKGEKLHTNVYEIDVHSSLAIASSQFFLLHPALQVFLSLLSQYLVT